MYHLSTVSFLIILFSFCKVEAQSYIESMLPIIKITTSESIPDEPKVNGLMEIIWHKDGSINASTDFGVEYRGPIGIELRGQSSLFFFPKKGYAIETRDLDGNDLDTSFLDFPIEEDWILHGPYSDKTLLRNDLAMHLGNGMGLYHSKTRHVELMLNGEYYGIYLLMEKIKRDKSRVDIASLKPQDVDGDELTGGYVIKIDKGDPDWYSRYKLWQRENYTAFQFVSPNRASVVNAQRDYITSYVDSFERALYSNDFTFGDKRYDEYIDIGTFADHFILKELSKDADAYRISSYYHKDKDSKGGKLKAGPAWDFNIAFGNINYCDGSVPSGWMYLYNCDGGIPFWWFRLMDDAVFRNTLKCRWNELSNTILSKAVIFNYIDEKSQTLLPFPVERNFERWPTLSEYVWPNALVTGNYAAEINYLKEFISDRWDWLDNNMPGLCNISEVNDPVLTNAIHVYPNPASQILNIEIISSVQNYTLALIDNLGRVVYAQATHDDDVSNRVTIPIDGLPGGIYRLLVTTKAQNYGVNVIVE